MSTLQVGGDRQRADSSTSTAVPSAATSMDIPAAQAPITSEKHQKLVQHGNGNDLPEAKFSVGITLRTVIMTILTAMGGFIFGYDTGQISGFLEMRVFLRRFGEPTPVTKEHPYGYYFTNVRSGLIVALVSPGNHSVNQIANTSSFLLEPLSVA
jgi:Sugar (and other) transporter